MSRQWKVGDRVAWRSHGGHAEGTIVRVAGQAGQIQGVHYHASPDDPRYIVETDEGKRAAHKAGELRRL